MITQLSAKGYISLHILSTHNTEHLASLSINLIAGLGSRTRLIGLHVSGFHL